MTPVYEFGLMRGSATKSLFPIHTRLTVRLKAQSVMSGFRTVLNPRRSVTKSEGCYP